MLLVDGMNVVGSRPDGWWRDRRAAMASLVRGLDALLERDATRAVVVFDGRPFDLPRLSAALEVRFASRRGPNAADDDIVALVEASGRPADLCVVTSDTALAERVRALGAEVIGAQLLRRRIDEAAER